MTPRPLLAVAALNGAIALVVATVLTFNLVRDDIVSWPAFGMLAVWSTLSLWTLLLAAIERPKAADPPTKPSAEIIPLPRRQRGADA